MTAPDHHHLPLAIQILRHRPMHPLPHGDPAQPGKPKGDRPPI